MVLRAFSPLLGFAALALVACPNPPSKVQDSGNPLPAPTIVSLTPDAGPPSGGTFVSVLGTNFQAGAQLFIGGAAAKGVNVINAFQLTGTTPPGDAGVASVRVLNPDLQAFTLANGFAYLGERIAEARLLNAASASDTSGANPVTVTVIADVAVPGVTDGGTQGRGVIAQAGWGPGTATDLSGFTWTPATFAQKSPTPGLDRYSGPVHLVGATGALVLGYLVTMRFSLDNGGTWIVADRAGALNGTDFSQLARVQVSQPVVAYCNLGGDSQSTRVQYDLKVGDAPVTVYGQVYQPGVTDKAGQGPGIAGQLGYGLRGTDPSAVGWTWMDAGYHLDQHGGSNDEYQASLSPPPVGGYDLAYRFALNGGPYLYCDSNGSQPYTSAEAGVLDVSRVGIDACILQFPGSLAAQSGTSTGEIYGRVWAARVTDDAGQGPGIVAELGWGPSDAGYLSNAWTWLPTTYNTKYFPYDEYQASFTVPPPGTYDYLYRFAYNGGPKVYCDLSGGDGGSAPTAFGHLTATPFTPNIQTCRTESVTNSNPASGQSITAYGLVSVPGVTDRPGMPAGVRAQVGVGPQDDPATSPLWGWREAEFNTNADAGMDEYVATLGPAYSGSRGLAFRFSLNDGGAWTYCDAVGTFDGGYNVANGWNLNVGVPQFDFCNLQFPKTLTQPADGGSTRVYGQVFLTAVTNQLPTDAIWGQLGYGQKSEDPGVSAGWTWVNAAYDTPTVGPGNGLNNDEFNALLTGVPAGTWYYAFRFSVDGGSYCYGDNDWAGSNENGGGMQGTFNGDTGTGPNIGVGTVTP